jgi:ribosome biogenesis SPOUT family RNA methylase Rps3
MTSENVCMMDMRAEKQLCPDDSKIFKFLLFGGILGDHPPADKAKEMREAQPNIRNLDEV